MSMIMIWLSRVAAAVALAGLIAALISGWGYENGHWDLGKAFKMIEYALKGGGAAAAVGLLILVVGFFGSKAGQSGALIALVIGGGVAGFLFLQIAPAASLPMIHDITTDVQDPPQFVDIVALRADSPNTLEYIGTTAKANRKATEERLVSELQLEAYPNIKPLMLALSADDAFALAVRVAQEQSWDIVAIDDQARRIEATDTTKWFGFKDDIIILVHAEADGQARVDMRSISRVGLSDVGLNAKRIGAYLAELEQAAG